MIDPRTGRLHTTFNQTVASTGRLVTTDPNLQNIPIRSDAGQQIRRAFVPGRPDHVLLSADYAQIELRVLAHITGDPGLLEAFGGGRDIHAVTAPWGFGGAVRGTCGAERVVRIDVGVRFELPGGRVGGGVLRIGEIREEGSRLGVPVEVSVAAGPNWRDRTETP